MKKIFSILGLATVGVILLLELFQITYEVDNDTMPRAWWNGGKKW